MYDYFTHLRLVHNAQTLISLMALWRLTTISSGIAFVFALSQLGIAVAIHIQALRASGNLRHVLGAFWSGGMSSGKVCE